MRNRLRELGIADELADARERRRRIARKLRERRIGEERLQFTVRLPQFGEQPDRLVRDLPARDPVQRGVDLRQRAFGALRDRRGVETRDALVRRDEQLVEVGDRPLDVETVLPVADLCCRPPERSPGRRRARSVQVFGMPVNAADGRAAVSSLIATAVDGSRGAVRW